MATVTIIATHTIFAKVGRYGQNFFSAKVVDKQNELDENTELATSVNAFKHAT